MILAISQYDVVPGMELMFEAGIELSRRVFVRANGYLGMELHRSAEQPSRYRHFVQWETIDDHKRRFRASRLQQEFDVLIADCIAVGPITEHCTLVVSGGCNDPLPLPPARPVALLAGVR